jgi:hypothetical protein
MRILAEQMKMKFHRYEDIVDAVVEKRYQAAYQLHLAIGESSVTPSTAAESVAALNEPLVCPLIIHTPVVHARLSLTGETDHTVPISSTAQPGFWINRKQIETSILQVDLESSPLINLPRLTTDGVIDRRQQNLRVMALSLKRSAWHEPPYRHWAPAHDELVLEHWDAYLIATKQRSADHLSLNQQSAALPALRAYSSRQQHRP